MNATGVVDAVRATGLGVRLGDRWLFRDLDLTLRPGECVALVGRNGTGKSTLLRCLYGLEPATEGTVWVCGDPPDERSVAFRHQVSVLLDDSDTFPELTPRQHVELLLGTFDAPGDPDALLASVGLAGQAAVPAGGLSAGQRRRLLLLAATARPHRVLLLDEPERALDAAGKRWLGTWLGGAKSEVATVLATHHTPLVRAVADRVVRLG